MSYTEERDRWLASLKVGDRVMVGGRWNSYDEIRRVARITATQIVLDDTHGSRFRRRDGGGLGGDRRFVREVTPEAEHKFNVDKARETLRYTRWERIPDHVCLELAIRLAAAIAEQKTEAVSEST